MVDRYTKVILTVIAAALVWLCLWGAGPDWGTPAEAQYGSTQDVNIAEIGGKTIQVSALTSFSGVSAVQGLPVDVRNIGR